MLSRVNRAFLAVCVAFALVACSKKEGGAPKGEPLKVAAAADLAFAFKDVGDAFEKKTGRKVTFSFGSTGLLSKQIVEGAPFDVFAAANVAFIDDVVKEGACLNDAKSLYAIGRIVMWTKKGSPLPKSVTDLTRSEFAKVAIANPDHAPYGKAAKQAMERANVWAAVQPKVVYGENVQQTLQFAQSGNADVAIVALSLATVSDGEYSAIDPATHDTLEQAIVVCKGSPSAAGGMQGEGRAFTGFVNSDEGRAIMRKYGFLLPGEALNANK
jgi:molybdate transport system substrate-binding protein